MLIANELQAKRHASKYLKHNTLVVGENGDIHANCNVDDVCKQHEDQNEKFFIINGERVAKKSKVKTKDNDAETE